MRIARLRLKNHPGIGDIDVDFRDSDGKAARLVVIAGENGTGKTAILQSIYQMMSVPEQHKRYPDFEISALVERCHNESFKNDISLVPKVLSESDLFELSGFYNRDVDGLQGFAFNEMTAIAIPTMMRVSNPVNNIAANAACFYSTSEITFRVPQVQQIGLMQEGSDIQHKRITDENLASSIISMLVALKGADDAQLSKWVASNPGRVPPEPIIQPRVKRFREAFSLVMPYKNFDGVEQLEGSFHPIFEQDGRTTTLSDLSTGEKQIVFRGAFLLRSIHQLENSIVLIDEPELGLHPNWQSRILDYYEKIVGGSSDSPNQIILTTHSPFVVHGSPAAKHVILKRNVAAKRVEVDSTSSYPGITPGDLAIAAFDLSNMRFGQKGNNLAIVTEGPTDASILEIAWRKLYPNRNRPFDLLPARGATSIPSLLGTAEGIPGPLADAAIALGIERLIGLFDFDHEGYPQWNGMASKKVSDDECLDEARCSRRRRKGCLIWAALLPLPEHRSRYASHEMGFRSGLSIELLFPDAYVRGMLTETLIPLSAEPLLTVSPKNKIRIATSCADFPESAFADFVPIFDLAEHVRCFSRPKSELIG